MEAFNTFQWVFYWSKHSACSGEFFIGQRGHHVPMSFPFIEMFQWVFPWSKRSAHSNEFSTDRRPQDVPTNFPLVEALIKLLFWFDGKPHHRISFHAVNVQKSQQMNFLFRQQEKVVVEVGLGGELRRGRTRLPEFKSWTRLSTLHIALMPLENLYESNYSSSSLRVK